MKIIDEITQLTYDDVLCKPGKSLESREHADVRLGFFGTTLEHPIIPANMDTISGKEMCAAILKTGGIAILHRFMSDKERAKIWYELAKNSNLFISVGVSKEEIDVVKLLHSEGIRKFCIDIAHGHSDKVKEVITLIRDLDKKHNTLSIIIAGNIATAEGFKFLAEAGADVIKVGIGPGSLCTTRIVTGCGVPQLSAVIDIVNYRDFCASKKYIPIIADGGIKNSGDIVKALAAGADLVMAGSLFAGCIEAPGDVFKWKDGTSWKMYRGMASKDAQVGWKNTDPNLIVPEGESSLVPLQGSVSLKIHQLVGGIKSGMSYIGANTLTNLKNMTIFIKVSNNTVLENGPHGKRS